MTGKTHQALGLALGLGYIVSVSSGYQPATLGAALIGAHFGALLPDIDQPASSFWRSLPFGRVAGELSDPFLKHRNITHSLVGAVIISLLIRYLLSLFPKYWGINTDIVLASSMLAYGSHLLSDAFTVEGIPFLFPWKKMMGIPPKPFEGFRIQTGKWFENLVIFPAINILIILLIHLNWDTIKGLMFK
ncbi:MAG TPA: metal-dependent hydrolase [bacterium]|nr:metal-dependent hydrolase [bacterium]